MSGTQSGFFDSLVSAVRENPLSAALIGGGALWLLAGDERLKSAVNSATTAASPIADIGARKLQDAALGTKRTAAPPTAPEMDHERSFRVGEALRDANSAAAEAVSGTADKIKDRLDEGVASARVNMGKLGNSLPGKDAFTKAQSSLADVFDRQPLVLGAVGLAIGIAVAGAFRTSALENEWVGDLSDDLKSDLNTRAGTVSQSLHEASDTFRAELGDAGADAVDRLKQAGLDAADAAREQIRSR
jgi:hypothetical protein